MCGGFGTVATGIVSTYNGDFLWRIPGISVMLNRQGHLSLQLSFLQLSYGIQNVHPCILERGRNG